MKSINYKHLGQKLRKIRLERGMTQEHVADSSPISAKYYSAVETGSVHVSLSALIHIANALDTPLSPLLDSRHPAPILPLETTNAIRQLSAGSRILLINILELLNPSIDVVKKAANPSQAIGYHLQSARTIRQYSKQKLADALHIEVGTLANIESGSRSPSLALLYSASQILNFPIDYFLCECLNNNILAIEHFISESNLEITPDKRQVSDILSTYITRLKSMNQPKKH